MRRQSFINKGLTAAVAAVFLAGALTASRADTVIWNRTVTAGVGPFDYNTAGNWIPLGVPAAADTALFTNVSDTATVALSAPAIVDRAVFDLAPNRLRVRLNPGSFPWTIASEMIVGYSTTEGTSQVLVVGGTVAVTNPAHTARVVVGGTLRSRLYLQSGGQLIADHLYATNAYLNWGIDIDNGTLTTLGDSLVDTNAAGTQYLPVGVSPGRGEWDMLGGTNIIRTPYVRLGWQLYVPSGAVATGKLVVANSGTVCECVGRIEMGCDTSSVGVVVVSNGATLRTSGGPSSVGVNSGSYRDASRSGAHNLFLVTGAGSKYYDGYQFYVGWGRGNDNTLRIENGGTMVKTNSGALYIGISALSSNNQVIVDGPGSLLTDFGDILVGGAHSQGDYGDGKLIVTNGGVARSDRWSNVYCGNRPNAYGEVLVTGPGSTLRMSGILVGSNAQATVNGRGTVLIVDGGMLDADIAVGANFLGTVTNQGGIFQFGARNPGVSRLTPGAIVVTNGTISFRDISDAYVYGNQAGAQATRLTNVLFLGNNTFRLNNASNTTWGQDYVFDTGRGPTNYVRLELVNGHTGYRGGGLTIGSGGTLFFSNTVATIAAGVTNRGTLSGWGTVIGTVVNEGVQAVGISSAGTADRLDIEGLLSLGTNSGVTVANPAALNAGQQYVIATYTTLTGRFRWINIPGWSVRYDDANRRIVLYAPPPGSMLRVR